MTLLYGSSLGYSGSTPEPSHCPCREHEDCANRMLGHCQVHDCEETDPLKDCNCPCPDCRRSDWPLCTEPQEHVLCGSARAEAEQARAEYLWEDR